MGLLDIFKKKLKFKDELFGELGYNTFRDKSNNFYEGSIIFNSQEIAVILDADENGPTIKQKEFYSKIKDNYSSIKNDIIIPYLTDELDEWMNEKPILNFDDEFTIDGISLPRIIDKPVEWSITYYSKSIYHYVTIQFCDLVPQEGVIVDG